MDIITNARSNAANRLSFICVYCRSFLISRNSMDLISSNVPVGPIGPRSVALRHSSFLQFFKPAVEISFMRMRAIILAFLAILGGAASLDAQYVRIDNAGTIPNGAVRPPTIITSTLALYTEDARTHGIEGIVAIEAVVGEDGQIKTMRVLKGLGFGLDEVALAAVQEWEFSPATQNGIPVSVVAEIDVQFSLRIANALRRGPGKIVTPPTVRSRVEPQYTEEARAARLNGTVVLEAVVETDGTVDVVRVVRGLPYGLTDSAINTIKQWKFRPGNKDGHDVDMVLNIDINFNLQ